ncbi:MAG: hypothetical protein LW884_05960 [Bacteroidetes bacterium]|jgi:hypothetical protein|nr:hypothetical protein [Bacteroidota bacterium]
MKRRCARGFAVVLLLLACGGLVLLPGCNDPADGAPRPTPGPGVNILPEGIIQANFLNNYFSYRQPYNYWGQETAQHYVSAEGTVYLTRASQQLADDPVLGPGPAYLYSIVLEGIDLDQLPIPYVFGQTPLPANYAYAQPRFYLLHESRLTDLPTFEIATNGAANGIITYAEITHKEGDALRGTFTGVYSDPLLQQDVSVLDGSFHIRISRR